jgi:hypothetical protein
MCASIITALDVASASLALKLAAAAAALALLLPAVLSFTVLKAALLLDDESCCSPKLKM